MQPCELVVGKILPAMRALVVDALMNKYKLKQTEVSELLGITQAAVSHYRRKKRAYDKSILKQFPELKRYADGVAKSLAEEKAGRSNKQIALFCGACRDIKGTRNFCSYHKLTQEIEGCDICFLYEKLAEG